MEKNYNTNNPKWVDANYPITSMNDDVQVNVLEEALPFQTNHINKRAGKKIRNPKHRSYNFMDSNRLVQTLFKIYVFYRIRRCVITKCPHIDSEVKDGFVRHVGQQMLEIDHVEQIQNNLKERMHEII